MRSTACASARKSTMVAIFRSGSPKESAFCALRSPANRSFLMAVLRAVIASTPSKSSPHYPTQSDRPWQFFDVPLGLSAARVSPSNGNILYHQFSPRRRIALKKCPFPSLLPVGLNLSRHPCSPMTPAWRTLPIRHAYSGARVRAMRRGGT